MFEVESPTWIAVLMASVYLLQSAIKEKPMSRWLSPFSLGWLIAGLLFLYPFLQKGSWVAASAAYFLMAVLIINTLVLSVTSKLPSPVVSYKSEGVEKVGLMYIGFICAGLVVVIKSCLFGVTQLWLTKPYRQERELPTWSNV